MLKQLCKHHLSRQLNFTPKTYNHAVTYNLRTFDSDLSVNLDILLRLSLTKKYF